MPNSVSPTLGRSWNLCSTRFLSSCCFFLDSLKSHPVCMYGLGRTKMWGNLYADFRGPCSVDHSFLGFSPLISSHSGSLELWPKYHYPVKTFCFSSISPVPHELRSTFGQNNSWINVELTSFSSFFQGFCTLWFLSVFYCILGLKRVVLKYFVWG